MNRMIFFLIAIDYLITFFAFGCVLAAFLGLIFVIQKCAYIDDLDGQSEMDYCNRVYLIYCLIVIPICIFSSCCWFAYKAKKWEMIEKYREKAGEPIMIN